MPLHANTDGEIRNDKEQIAYLEGQVSKLKTALKEIRSVASKGSDEDYIAECVHNLATNALTPPQDLASA